MTPLKMLTDAIRDLLAQRRGATPAELKQLRQLAIHCIDHDASRTDEARAALRDVPSARSFATDAGIGRS